MKHNLFSPSSAHIWRYCLQSQLLKQGEESKDNEAMKRGRYLHYLFTRLLRNGYIDTTLCNKEYQATNQDIDFVYEAYNEIKEEYKGSSYNYLEKFFPLEVCKQKIGGTPDLAFIKNSTLYVYDLKMGRTKIDVYKHEQLLLYATAVVKYLENLDIPLKEIKLGIIQPSIRNYDYWTFDISQLESNFLPIVEKIANQDYGFYTGDHCQYCPSKNKCPLIQKGLQIVSKNNPIEQLDDNRKKFILSIRKGVERLFVEIENEFITRLLAEETIDGVDIVPVKPRITLDESNESNIKSHLGDDIYAPKTILSYAQIRNKLTDLIAEKDGCKKSEAKIEAIELLKPYVKKAEITKYKIKVK